MRLNYLGKLVLIVIAITTAIVGIDWLMLGL
jgi:hypothetical protein